MNTCARDVDFITLSSIFRLSFETAITVWYLLFFFYCDILSREKTEVYYLHP
jgi:hypothetical protein